MPRRNPDEHPYALSRLVDRRGGAPMTAMAEPSADADARLPGEPAHWSDGSELGLEESQARARSRADWWMTHGSPEQQRYASALMGSGLDQPSGEFAPNDPSGLPTWQQEERNRPMATVDGARRGSLGQLLDMPASRTRMSFEGFNTDRAASGGDPKSVKDTFYRVMQGLDLGPEMFETWEGTTDAVANIIAPALREAGLDVLSTNKDKILIRTAENPGGEWVDLIRGAGAAGAAAQWGAEGAVNKAASPTGLPLPTFDATLRGPAVPGAGPAGTGIREDAYQRIVDDRGRRAPRPRSRVRDLLSPGVDEYGREPLV